MQLRTHLDIRDIQTVITHDLATDLYHVVSYHRDSQVDAITCTADHLHGHILTVTVEAVKRRLLLCLAGD